MVKVKLHGELGKQVQRDEFELAVLSVGEAIRAIEVLSGFKLYRSLLDNDQKGIEYQVLINGRGFKSDLPLDDPEHIDNVYKTDLVVNNIDLKSIDIIPIFAGDKKALGFISIIIGVALIATGFGAFGGLGIISTFGKAALVVAGLGLVASGVTSLLAKPPKFQDFREIDGQTNRTSYLFNGAVNTTREGGPVPLGYGRLIVGSQVISSSLFTEYEENPDTEDDLPPDKPNDEVRPAGGDEGWDYVSSLRPRINASNSNRYLLGVEGGEILVAGYKIIDRDGVPSKKWKVAIYNKLLQPIKDVGPFQPDETIVGDVVPQRHTFFIVEATNEFYEIKDFNNVSVQIDANKSTYLGGDNLNTDYAFGFCGGFDFFYNIDLNFDISENDPTLRLANSVMVLDEKFFIKNNRNLSFGNGPGFANEASTPKVNTLHPFHGYSSPGATPEYGGWFEHWYRFIIGGKNLTSNLFYYGYEGLSSYTPTSNIILVHPGDQAPFDVGTVSDSVEKIKSYVVPDLANVTEFESQYFIAVGTSGFCAIYTPEESGGNSTGGITEVANLKSTVNDGFFDIYDVLFVNDIPGLNTNFQNLKKWDIILVGQNSNTTQCQIMRLAYGGGLTWSNSYSVDSTFYTNSPFNDGIDGALYAIDSARFGIIENKTTIDSETGDETTSENHIGSCYVGGDFSIGGNHGVVRLRDTGGLDSGFKAGLKGPNGNDDLVEIRGIDVDANLSSTRDTIYLGGRFSQIRENDYSNLASYEVTRISDYTVS